MFRMRGSAGHSLAGAVGILLLAVLSGCVAGPGAPASTVTAQAFDIDDPLLAAGDEAGEPSRAAGLAGFWQVSDAEGDVPGTYVGVGIGPDTSGIEVYRDCGSISFDLAASEERLIARLSGGSGFCFGDATMVPPSVPWLTAARGYRSSGEGWELTDAEGQLVARLIPAVGLPELPEGTGPSPLPVPTVVEPERVRVAAPLAPGLTAVTADGLVGTWSPVGPGSDDPPDAGSDDPPASSGADGLADDARATITFTADGHYTFEDCASFDPPADAPTPEQTEAFALVWAGDGAEFLATSYAVSAIGCSPRWPMWESRTTTIALDHGYLRLFDRAGAELGRLERVG